ncbi:MAG: SspB family protein [Alphaproteobacteria bacterium]
MEDSQIRYDLLMQDALKSVVQTVLIDAAENGLPGDHHFYIAFDTRHPNVTIDDELKAAHPEEMSIVLQHQYEDLEVDEYQISVTLRFNRKPHRLVVPFEAVKGFFDPSVQFGLQFEVEVDNDGDTGHDPTDPPTGNDDTDLSDDDADDGGDKPEKSGEVIALDQFRKKPT